jgi:hypothetical protein
MNETEVGGPRYGRPSILTMAKKAIAFDVNHLTQMPFYNTYFYSSLLLSVGCLLQGYTNKTSDAILSAVFFLLVGVSIIFLLFSGREIEMRFFVLTYTLYVFMGGLTQCYSIMFFDNVMSTKDAFTFISQISQEPPFTTIADLPYFNSPLAVIIWQQLYKIAWWFKLDFGIYIAVMFNALVMGITGSITIGIARDIYGNDSWRLQKVGLLYTFCGLFMLFGAVLLRDCFTTLLNTLVLWAIVGWLIRKTTRQLILSVLITALSAYAMVYLRAEAVVLFGLFWILAIFFWFISKRLDVQRIMIVVITFCVLLIAAPKIIEYINVIQKIQASGLEAYSEFSASKSSSESLGLKMIVNQPLPIRLAMGSVWLLMFPIPLWTYFNSHSLELYWFISYNGFYQLLCIPLFLIGIIMSIIKFRGSFKNGTPLVFLSAYFIMNLFAVTATSLDQRHFYQFMPSCIIVAALPNTQNVIIKKYVGQATFIWFYIIIAIHLTWFFMKAF